MKRHDPGTSEQGTGGRVVGRKRARRRALVKVGAAIGGGLGLGTTYVDPTMLSVSVYETAYASGRQGVNSQGGNGQGRPGRGRP